MPFGDRILWCLESLTGDKKFTAQRHRAIEKARAYLFAHMFMVRFHTAHSAAIVFCIVHFGSWFHSIHNLQAPSAILYAAMAEYLYATCTNVSRLAQLNLQTAQVLLVSSLFGEIASRFHERERHLGQKNRTIDHDGGYSVFRSVLESRDVIYYFLT